MGRFIWKELLSLTTIGRWLELRVVIVRHSASMAMCNYYSEDGKGGVSTGV